MVVGTLASILILVGMGITRQTTNCDKAMAGFLAVLLLILLIGIPCLAKFIKEIEKIILERRKIMVKFEQGQIYEDIEYREEESECVSCESKTHWFDTTFGLPFCSEECAEKYWESMG